MTNEIEQKLRLLEASITLFRKHLLSSQSLRSVLIDLYNLLENEEIDEKIKKVKKNAKN